MKAQNLPKTILKLISVLVMSVFKTTFIDFPKNIKEKHTYSFNVEKRKQLKQELEITKKVGLMEDRVKRLERLIYSVFEDPEYTKRESGKQDVKELTKEVK